MNLSQQQPCQKTSVLQSPQLIFLQNCSNRTSGSVKSSPTLCLWAGTQPNMWNIPKKKIMGVLNYIIPIVLLELSKMVRRLTVQHKMVSMVSHYVGMHITTDICGIRDTNVFATGTTASDLLHSHFVLAFL